MSRLDLLRVGHVLVFAVWFGTDLATFHLSRKLLDRSVDVGARRVLAGAMLGVEVLARLCLPTMLALGLSLAVELGAVDGWSGTGPLVAIWLVAVAWVAMVWTIHVRSHRGAGGELSDRLALVDLVLRSAVCLALWVAGLASLIGDGGPFLGDWVAAKVVFFALVMSCGIAIRFVLRPFSGAFARLVAEGSNDVTERAMADCIRRAQPLVGTIWLGLLSAALVGVLQRLPWQ